MSVTHFRALAVLALQLGVLVEKYRRAIEAECTGPSREAGEPTAADLLRDGSPLAFAVSALWVDWGRLVVAHNALLQERLRGAAPEVLHKAQVRAVTSAHLFTSRCVHWALFEQPKASVPFHTADAFIAWEGARRSAWQLREQVEAFQAESQSTEIPKALADITAQAERNANRLLVQALVFLDGNDGDPAEAGD